MSLLSEKYKIPESTIKTMIADGVISCSWNTYDEIIKLKRAGKTPDEIADTTHMSKRYVYSILNRVK